MIDRFKKVFIICSTEQYDFLEQHKDEILKPYRKQKIIMPYLFGNLESGYNSLLAEAKEKLDDTSFSDLSNYSNQRLQEDKYIYASKKMKNVDTCIYIAPIIESEKDVDASNEVTLELICARKISAHIHSIKPNELEKAKEKVIKKYQN